MKCANPTCTHKAHQGRKKCFQCLLSNAKYMRNYRRVKKLDLPSYYSPEAKRTLASLFIPGERLAEYCEFAKDGIVKGTEELFATGELGRVQGIEIEEESNIGSAL